MTNSINKGSLIGIAGSGVMGRGIAQLCATAGYRVRLYDLKQDALDAAEKSISEIIARLEQKGRLSRDDASATLSRIEYIDDIKGMAPCKLVIEAIFENLEAKQSLITELESVGAGSIAIASNTSSLSISALAAKSSSPERIAGLHFFNPVPLMKLTEVISGIRTSPQVGRELTNFITSTGHRAVHAADTPGFLVNHAGRGLYTEGLRIVEEQVIDPQGVDRALRDQCGFKMGPFELFDLTGLDVSGKVLASIFEQFYSDPRYRPSALVPQRINAGLFGRKSGEGFYLYKDGKAVIKPEPHIHPAATPLIWIDVKNDNHIAEELSTLLRKLGASIDVAAVSGPHSACLVAPIGQDATTTAIERQLEPRRVVAIDTLFGLDRRRVIMPTPITAVKIVDGLHTLLASDGTPVTRIQDSPGFIAQRTLAVIVNIACEIAQRGIATCEDIDIAVRTGLNYPRGPLEWGDLIGADTILLILDRLYAFTRDPRYRASIWLRRRAMLAVSLLTPDQR